MLRILDSNESMTVKMQALENHLQFCSKRKHFGKLHHPNRNHQGTLESNVYLSHMMHGFTPFCLQKLEQGSEIAYGSMKNKSKKWHSPC